MLGFKRNNRRNKIRTSTELRARSRTASWTFPRMAPKIEREWQSQLDAMEKRVMERIENLDKKIMENTKELCSTMKENLVKSNEKLMGEIKSLVVTEMKEIKIEIGEIRSEMTKTENKVHNLETKVQELEKQIEEIKQDNKNCELKYKIKMRDLQLS